MKVLITGANSYIGESLKSYLQENTNYVVDIIDTIGLLPTKELFFSYDVVVNTAGIAHIKETKENQHLYFDVNRDLALKIAEAAKEAGVSQYILLSSMSVYGKTTGQITKATEPNPTNAYGLSKLQADELIREMEDDNFKFACLRPPMVYGKGCKGNYQLLRKFALISPFFPNFQNQRSMVYVGNLCEFIRQTIANQNRGLFFPQNAEYVETRQLVQQIAKRNKKRCFMVPFFNPIIKRSNISVIEKVFGSLTYEPSDLVYSYGFEESIRITEE